MEMGKRNTHFIPDKVGTPLIEATVAFCALSGARAFVSGHDGLAPAQK
jgi:hypothetical protein